MKPSTRNLKTITVLILGLLVVGLAGAGESGSELKSLMAEMVELAGPSPTQPAFRLKTGDQLAFIGDSITQSGGYLRVVAHVLKTQYQEAALPYFLNAGIPSQTSGDMAARFAASVKLSEKPAYVFINAGLNDIFRGGLDKPHDPATLAAFRTHITQMVEQAQQAGSHVILLAPTIWGESAETDANKRLILYADAMKQIAADKQCGFVDLHRLFLGALARKKAALALTSGDGIHMNGRGDALMAIGVLRALGVPDSQIAATDLTPLLSFR